MDKIMNKKIEPVLIFDEARMPGLLLGGSMIGSSDVNDWRLLSVRNAQIGELDARGKKLTLSFFEGARFKTLKVDQNTELYDDQGIKIFAAAHVGRRGEDEVLEARSS